MGKRRAIAVLLVVVCVAAAPAGTKKPDEATVKRVQELATASVKEFEAGNTTKAIDLMQQAIAVMQKVLTGNLAAFLPEAPTDWVAGKIEEQAVTTTGGGAAQWTQVSRTYTKKDDSGKVEIQLTNSPMFVQMQDALWKSYQNPLVLQMLNQNAEVQVKLLDREGWKGFTTVEKGKEAKAILFIPECLLTVEVPGGSVAVLEQFVNLLPLKDAATALGGAKPVARP